MCLKVLIIDDHKLMAAALKDALDEVDDLRVVGVAHSGPDGLSMLTRTQPDMLLIDLNLPGMSAIECLDLAHKDYPRIKAVMISDGNDYDRIRACFQHGATAFIAKTVDPADLPAALRHVYDGTVFHAPAGLDQPAPDPLREAGLTERELEVLKAVSSGLSNKAISKQFWVTEQTVKFHLNNVYRKLGVPNRTAAAALVHEHGLALEPVPA